MLTRERSMGILSRLETEAINSALVHKLYFIFCCVYNSSHLLFYKQKNKILSVFHYSHLSQVFVWLTEPLRTIDAVLNAASVYGVVVLVVQE